MPSLRTPLQPTCAALPGTLPPRPFPTRRAEHSGDGDSSAGAASRDGGGDPEAAAGAMGESHVAIYKRTRAALNMVKEMQASGGRGPGGGLAQWRQHHQQHHWQHHQGRCHQRARARGLQPWAMLCARRQLVPPAWQPAQLRAAQPREAGLVPTAACRRYACLQEGASTPSTLLPPSAANSDAAPDGKKQRTGGKAKRQAASPSLDDSVP